MICMHVFSLILDGCTAALRCSVTRTRDFCALLFAGQFHGALPSVERGPMCTFSHMTHDSGTFWFLLVTEYGNLGRKVRRDWAEVLWEGQGLGNGLLFYRLS